MVGATETIKKAMEEDPILSGYKCFSEYLKEYAVKTPLWINNMKGKILREAKMISIGKPENAEVLDYYMNSFSKIKSS